MALELFSESWATWPAAPSTTPPAAAASSPRISFSRDLDASSNPHRHHIHHQQRADGTLMDSSSSPDFHFCVSGDRHEQDYSYGAAAADELFSDGFLLPLPILPRGPSPLPSALNPSTAAAAAATTSSSSVRGITPVTPSPTSRAEAKKDSFEEISTVPVSDGGGGGGAAEEKPAASGKQPASFWKFGRSSSLNCGGAVGGSGGRRASLICSLPLLSRSKSTGSHPNPPALKQRQQSFNGGAAIPTPSTGGAASSGGGSKLSRKGSANGGTAARNPYYYGQHQQGGGGVRISPVLNVPPPYIPKGGGAGLFSFGHLLCSSRERSRKKAQQAAAAQ